MVGFHGAAAAAVASEADVAMDDASVLAIITIGWPGPVENDAASKTILCAAAATSIVVNTFPSTIGRHASSQATAVFSLEERRLTCIPVHAIYRLRRRRRYRWQRRQETA